MPDRPTNTTADTPAHDAPPCAVHIFFRHFKGRYYQVLGEALDTTNEGRVVVYRTLYPSAHALFTRPWDEFHGWKVAESGERVRRFTAVPYDQLPDEARRMAVESLPVAGTDGPQG